MAYGLVIPNPEPTNDQDGLTHKDHNHPSVDRGLIPAPLKIENSFVTQNIKNWNMTTNHWKRTCSSSACLFLKRINRMLKDIYPLREQIKLKGHNLRKTFT